MALEQYGVDLWFACGFTVEDIVLLHMASSFGVTPSAFFVDTGRHFEETYQIADDVRRIMGIEVRWVFPASHDLDDVLARDGATTITSDTACRRRCCEVRRLGPARRALEGARAWVVGARRTQTTIRQTLAAVEESPATYGLPRYAPLADWRFGEVVNYARAKKLPFHALYRRGFMSIGCAPCTAAPRPGEAERAGRWPFEQEVEREAGQHLSGIWPGGKP